MELDWLLLSVTGILLILVLYLNFILHRTGRELEEQTTHLQQLQRDFEVFCTAGDELGKQVVRLELRVKKLAEWQDQINLHTPEARAYSQAIKMVRSGADIDQLVARCGLSQNEAELVYLLHNASSESNTVSEQTKAKISSL
ncbi:DUF2802 domain-containing protein [Nitrosococcus watsonii]|uniref:DUF2802 domain-containing protein n=1 Tax=Nitrosococcus watsoni (strain C-113) TaxID=105559 RepID=D8K4H8_NITWC|nr:DUF2802 domain-containing protein [Nitrosococcus watsonii]ADJ27875.1 conserved hypothetical protein [Nitrosococcus watsonii C-113]